MEGRSKNAYIAVAVILALALIAAVALFVLADAKRSEARMLSTAVALSAKEASEFTADPAGPDVKGVFEVATGNLVPDADIKASDAKLKLDILRDGESLEGGVMWTEHIKAMDGDRQIYEADVYRFVPDKEMHAYGASD